MGDAGHEDGSFFDGETKDQPIDTEADAIVVLAAVKLPGEGEWVFLERLKRIQNFLAKARGELPERALGAGQDFNSPQFISLCDRILLALY